MPLTPLCQLKSQNCFSCVYETGINLLQAWSCRAVVEQQVKEAQQRFRRGTCDTEEGKQCVACSSEDDIFRAYGVLLAISRYTDKLVLFSRTLLRDKFLLKRAPRRMFWRNAAYL